MANMILPRAASGEGGFAQGLVAALHLVGRDQLAVVEHRADLGVDGVHRLGVEGQQGHGARDLYRVLLQVEDDQDRQVVGVGLRPGADLFQAVGEQRANGAVVDVGHVDHLHPRPAHGREVVRRGVGRHLAAQRRQEAAALRVVDEVDLQLARAIVQLLAQGFVAVVQGVGRLRIGPAQIGHFLRRDGHLVAVVGADGLQRVHLQRIDGGARAVRRAGGLLQVAGGGHGGGGEQGGDHHGFLFSRTL
jgi:hypothetical protein